MGEKDFDSFEDVFTSDGKTEQLEKPISETDNCFSKKEDFNPFEVNIEFEEKPQSVQAPTIVDKPISYIAQKESKKMESVFESEEEIIQAQLQIDKTYGFVGGKSLAGVNVGNIEVNDVVARLIKLDEEETIIKKQRNKSNDEVLENEEVLDEKDQKRGILLVLVLAIIALTLWFGIFIAPQLATSLFVSNASEIQQRVVNAMQVDRTIQDVGDDFTVTFSYDLENYISELEIVQTNAEVKTTYTSGSATQMDSMLILDVNSSYSQVAYVSANLDGAVKYTVNTGTEITENVLDSTIGFVIILNRNYEICFYDVSGTQIYND